MSDVSFLLFPTTGSCLRPSSHWYGAYSRRVQWAQFCCLTHPDAAHRHEFVLVNPTRSVSERNPAGTISARLLQSFGISCVVSVTPVSPIASHLRRIVSTYGYVDGDQPPSTPCLLATLIHTLILTPLTRLPTVGLDASISKHIRHTQPRGTPAAASVRPCFRHLAFVVDLLTPWYIHARYERLYLHYRRPRSRFTAADLTTGSAWPYSFLISSCHFPPVIS